ncbi:hypothetical protein MLD38_004332 [Melastoma candidum]|uniref:Uncharacterized protein n=1 Tax=Melastoma candidum TaxID=119954 RepID=A0ACB9S5I3_9MYRT|nr:hypothetical protein MLD38_004332 [Melastoma candidum]
MFVSEPDYGSGQKSRACDHRREDLEVRGGKGGLLQDCIEASRINVRRMLSGLNDVSTPVGSGRVGSGPGFRTDYMQMQIRRKASGGIVGERGNGAELLEMQSLVMRKLISQT